MAVKLKTIPIRDAEARELQQNTADAIEALDGKPSAPLGVLQVSSGRTLVGNEDVVLVDASTATQQIALILPSPRVLTRRLSVRVVKGSPFNVVLKPVDIPKTGAPTINGESQFVVVLPTTVVSDGRNFWTV